MPYYHPNVLDNGLQYISTYGDALHMCSAEPVNFTEATDTLSLGAKTGITVGSPEARSPAGRKVVVPAVVVGAPGSVTDTGTATHFAVVDTVNSRLLAAGPLAASQAVTSGNSFTTEAIDVGLVGPS